MKYIVENWFVIVGLIAVCAAGGYAVYVFVKMPSDKQLNKVREWLLYAVTKAEKELGGGTGQIKLDNRDCVRCGCGRRIFSDDSVLHLGRQGKQKGTGALL